MTTTRIEVGFDSEEVVELVKLLNLEHAGEVTTAAILAHLRGDKVGVAASFTGTRNALQRDVARRRRAVGLSG